MRSYQAGQGSAGCCHQGVKGSAQSYTLNPAPCQLTYACLCAG